ncbi:subtilisin-like protease [Phaffia rhodozyma]|uniref:Subtilisin-like protease n=1 Tax=Phaffia rhodozyma TaxID=264483 RepID=A0A0F7SRW1_PHARH|nr:subtilisin-like protease [Phaffia rhodozyma]
MKNLYTLAALVLSGALSVVSAKVVDSSQLLHKAVTDGYVPHKWIVEFAPKTRKRTVNPHDHFRENMRKSGIPYDVVHTYDTTDLFVGASINVDDANEAIIKSFPGVINAYRVRKVPRPRLFQGQNDVLSGTRRNLDGQPATDSYSTHMMTGVDRLHAEGILGKGVVIAEIDSGIDYNHPALGGCFGPGCKVEGGFDFVGDDYDGSNEPVSGNDPMDCGGHGTHVAGIIGANANPLNFTGVAPEATLRIYRVFGCEGGSQNDVVMAAMIRAAEEKSDIIQMSLGGPAGWTTDPESVLAARIAKRGIVMSIAAGNDGTEGLFYSSAPSSGIDVISVASFDNIVTPSKSAELISPERYPSISLVGSVKVDPTISSPLFISNTDTSIIDDGCYPFNTSLTGKVAVIKRGSCTYAVKAENVQEAGGSIMLIYNNDESPITRLTGIPTVNYTGAAIAMADGLAIVAAYVNDPTIKISFPEGYVEFPNDLTGGLVSYFTTYGLTNDLYVKPSVGAPGGKILSTYPLALGGYTVGSGTSMSTPYISGVAALFISKNGRSKPKTIKSIFETHARPLPSSLDTTEIHTVVQQGGGLIDAYAAVHYQTVLSVSEFALNDTDRPITNANFTITNKGPNAVTYQISHVPAQTVYTFTDGDSQPNLDVPVTNDGATVWFNVQSITIKAGEAGQVTVGFEAPVLNGKSVPIYSGYIRVQSDDQTLQILYAGVADGSVHTEDHPAYTFVGNDVPLLAVRLLGGTPSLVVDLVAADTNFTSSINRRSEGELSYGVTVPVAPESLGSLIQYTYNYRNIPDSTENYEGYYLLDLTSDSNGFTWVDSSRNINKVPNGSYKILVRALKFFGDATKNEDYESWLSPVFTVAQP